MLIFKGISGLLSSRKGTLALLITLAATVVCGLGKLDGTAYAACIATVSSIFMWCHTKADVASMKP